MTIHDPFLLGFKNGKYALLLDSKLLLFFPHNQMNLKVGQTLNLKIGSINSPRMCHRFSKIFIVIAEILHCFYLPSTWRCICMPELILRGPAGHRTDTNPVLISGQNQGRPCEVLEGSADGAQPVPPVPLHPAPLGLHPPDGAAAPPQEDPRVPHLQEHPRPPQDLLLLRRGRVGGLSRSANATPQPTSTARDCSSSSLLGENKCFCLPIEMLPTPDIAQDASLTVIYLRCNIPTLKKKSIYCTNCWKTRQ